MDNISSVISIGSLNSKGVFEPEFEDEDVVEDDGPEGGAEDKEEDEEDKKEEWNIDTFDNGDGDAACCITSCCIC